jgi:aquaglyceroporin related protein
MSIEAFYPSPTSTASNRKMALRIPPPLHRSTLRPYLAEFIGTLLLILIGDGVVAQALLTNFHYANFLSVNLAWASAVSLSCYIGASVNPAITLASAIVRPSKQQWQQLPGKITAQFAGAFVGAALVYLQYASAIATWDPEYTVPGGSILSPQGHHSAGIFATYPAAHFGSNWEAAVAEFLGAATLALGVYAVADERNGGFKAPQFGLFGLMVAIGASMGWQTGYVSFCSPSLLLSFPPPLYLSFSSCFSRIEYCFTDSPLRPSTQLVTLDLEFSLRSSTVVKSSLLQGSTLWCRYLYRFLVVLQVLLCMMLVCLRVRGLLLLMLWILLRVMMGGLLLSEWILWA